MVTPADLSSADWAALEHLRNVQQIRVDLAGRHAESLARLAADAAINFDHLSTDVADDDVTEAQLALGFHKKHGGERADRRTYCSAPYWRWAPCDDGPGYGRTLLRIHEGRGEADIDWDEFCSYVIRSYGQRGQWPTIAMVAKRFKCSILDTVDWVDMRYWAGRGGAGELADQTVELDGE